ncbi:CAP domain-containing protein [Cytobacillus solani]|uniref:Serine protease n=1 Tax=Cytobacillus solani TaxID=1637975 RepID=A0A0Q3QNQ4_9BACI|nr:CAP domain-containing protein [Cytobacillus solani]KOP82765.1 serine protease [Bacillus sp. FJAT-21945]KQL19785.1 serine protease [Cytobacillus solani]USK53017.1 CAP domain-containing protein [Cytobacillus solani]
MRRLFRTLVLLFIFIVSWPFIEKQIQKTEYYPILESIKTEIRGIVEHPDVAAALNSIYQKVNEITGNEDPSPLSPNKNNNSETNQVKKPNLSIPTEQVFSIHNIILGEQLSEVEEEIGTAKRTSWNEYGTEWHTYHDDYQNFLMIAYDENNTVVGLYTNQDLITSSVGIEQGSTKNDVHEKLGDPLDKIRKGMTYFQLENDRDYDVYVLDESFVTIFYDKHKGNTVTSLQIITQELESNKKNFYSNGSQQLKEGFEYQLFDLTNAARVNHQLNVLGWDEHVKETARKHSKDMAENNYFSHTNLDGLSPFDRMSEDDIFYTFAGENLATGQFSSIFAHEGLMNSLGHRENILRPEYQYLGVGVAFNEDSHPYYTENFFRR